MVSRGLKREEVNISKYSGGMGADLQQTHSWLTRVEMLTQMG